MKNTVISVITSVKVKHLSIIQLAMSASYTLKRRWKIMTEIIICFCLIVGLFLFGMLVSNLYEVTQELYNIGCQLYDIKESIDCLEREG